MTSALMQNISLSQLRYFVSVVNNASFSKAATECNVAQPAISQHISSLERALGTSLFDRNNKQVTLTGAGEILYESVLGIMLTVENSFVEMERVSTQMLYDPTWKLAEGVSLRIGYYGTWEQMLLPEVIKAFRVNNPTALISINYILPQYIVSSLRRGLINVALTSVDHNILAPNIKSLKIAQSSIDLVVPMDSPLAERESIALGELDPEELLEVNIEPKITNGRATYIKNNVVEANKFKAVVPMLATDMHDILLSIEAGLGVSFFPHICCGKIARSQVKFIPIEDETQPVNIYCLWKTDNDDAGIRLFLKQLIQTAKSFT